MTLKERTEWFKRTDEFLEKQAELNVSLTKTSINLLDLFAKQEARIEKLENLNALYPEVK